MAVWDDPLKPINSDICGIESAIQNLDTAMGQTAATAQAALVAADKFARSLASVEGGDPGFTGVFNRLNDVKRGLTSLGHDIEIALSQSYFNGFVPAKIPKPSSIDERVFRTSLYSRRNPAIRFHWCTARARATPVTYRVPMRSAWQCRFRSPRKYLRNSRPTGSVWFPLAPRARRPEAGARHIVAWAALLWTG